MKYLLFFLLLVGCTSTPLKSPESKWSSLTTALPPGGVHYFSYLLPESWSHADVFCDQKKMQVLWKGSHLSFYLPHGYFAENFDCWLKRPEHATRLLQVQTQAKVFPEEEVKVAPSKVFIGPADQKRIREENQLLQQLTEKSHPSFLFDEPFELPRQAKITSKYGTQRLFNQQKTGQHLGIDFRAPRGSLVKASNRGKVVLARSLFYTGKTVVLDHGGGIFTLYGHLSRIKVKAGDLILQGNVLGLAGTTGRSTAPHLHWEAFVQGIRVDGMGLIQASQRNFLQ